MSKEDVTFELAPVYRKMGITYIQAKATDIFPEGSPEHPKPFVVGERTDPALRGDKVQLDYDFLINATGPQLNFQATPGLGPAGGYTYSVCTYEHTHETAQALKKLIAEMK